MNSSLPIVTVYYDGLCPLCSREIDHYRTRRGAEGLRLVDITAQNFNASAEGVDPILVHRWLHVRGPDGKLATGVAGFIEIWKVLPGYRWLARLGSVPPINWLMQSAYILFAKIRPLLPRKTRGCEESPYCDLDTKK